MTDENYALEIQQLEKMDLLELEDELSDIKFDLHVVDENEQQYGEPGTVIGIALAGALALPPLLLWLARHRRKFEIIEQESSELPGGVKVTRRIVVRVNESGSPSPEVLEQVRKLPVMDPTKLSEILDKFKGH